MERLSFKNLGIRSAAMAIVLASACGQAPDAEPIKPERAAVEVAVELPDEMAVELPETLESQYAPEINGAAVAASPAIRGESYGPEVDPEYVLQMLKSTEVRIPACNAFLIDDIGIVSAAHCFYKHVGETGTMMPGTGTPVTRPDGSLVGNVTDLIINRESDIAFGAFDGHVAQDVYNTFDTTQRYSQEELQQKAATAKAIYMVGSPHDYENGGWYPQQEYVLAPVAPRFVRLTYNSGEFIKDVEAVSGKLPTEAIDCGGALSGARGAMIAANNEIIQLGPFISRGEATKDSEKFKTGDFLCTFALEADPSNNVQLYYAGN